MTERYRFVCSDCGERIIVDRHVREEIVEEGCVVCQTTVEAGCFEVL